MKKTDSDKLTAIYRSAEIHKLDVKNMIAVLEKKMTILEERLAECRGGELTKRQEDMMDKIQNLRDEIQDSIYDLEEVLNSLEDLISVTLRFA